ncbi:restriction endonuclease subunit S [Aeromonas enteropelogenes]|uniref:restriction endonuclease subunit S n=1 Tax=Aeromonas enteropelogenes TaxID=29489 RepID=UPI003B9EC1F5
MSEVVTTRQQELAGKYRPYPEYKVSGVEWLQLCPSSWETKALKYIVSCNDEVLSESTDPDMEFEYIDIGGVSSSEGITRTESMRFSGSPSRARRIVRQGDIIVSTVRTYLEAIAPISLEFDGKIASTGFAVLRPKYLLSGFAQYALRARHFIDSVVARSTGVSYPAINSSELIDIKILVPSWKEQQTIAAFLDYETARIDRLITLQQRLIELLKEKRQAVISHAVTKGLNPDAPMKDSGVEWLGQIPDHWLSNRVGWCCQVGNGCTPSRDNMDYWSEGTYPWLNSGKVNDGYIISAEQFVTVTALKECSLPKVPAGSIVMAITGEGKTRGSVAMTGIDTTLSQHLAFITVTSTKISPMYLCVWLESQYQRIRFESEGWGSTKAAITCSDIKSYPLPEPPLNEQSKIVEYVGERSKTFDLLIQKSESMISVLQERRTALISAAVTGKIDLRGWTPPSDEEAA